MEDYRSSHQIPLKMKEQIGFKDFIFVTMRPLLWSRYDFFSGAVLHVLMSCCQTAKFEFGQKCGRRTYGHPDRFYVVTS